MTDTKKWRAFLRILRANSPDLDVYVRRYPCTKYHGITRFNGSKFYIRINSRDSFYGQIDTLLHEWAHAIQINNSYKHDKAWLSKYLQLKRLFT